MPVVFGAANTVTDSGTWTYPDVGFVIGLLVQVDSVGTGVDSWGGGIPRYTGIGVYAPITEAGRMPGRAVGNDQQVTYDIGHGPNGVAWDLSPGTSVTFTEILSETPPSGGGGGGTTGYAQIGGFGSGSLPTWNTGGVTFFGFDPASWAGTSATQIVVPTTTFYHFSFLINPTAGTTAPDAIAMEWSSLGTGGHAFNDYWEVPWPVGESMDAALMDGIITDGGGKVAAGSAIFPNVWTVGGDAVTYSFIRLTVVATNA